MIYITQLIYIKEGEVAAFLEFENHAIPLMSEYGGQLLLRIRPTDDTFIEIKGKKPYEIHFLTFPSEERLAAFLKDDRRQSLVHLKEQSIESVLLVKGQKM